MKKQYESPLTETLEMELVDMLAESLTISEEETSTVDSRDMESLMYFDE